MVATGLSRRSTLPISNRPDEELRIPMGLLAETLACIVNVTTVELHNLVASVPTTERGAEP